MNLEDLDDITISFENESNDLVIRRISPLEHILHTDMVHKTKTCIISHDVNISKMPPVQCYQSLINKEEGWQLEVYEHMHRPANPLWNLINIFILGSLGTIPGLTISDDLATFAGGGMGAAIGYIIPSISDLTNHMQRRYFEARYGLRRHPDSRYQKDRLFLINIRF